MDRARVVRGLSRPRPSAAARGGAPSGCSQTDFLGAPGTTRTCDTRFRKLHGGVLRGSQCVLGSRNLAKRGKACPGWSSGKLQKKQQPSGVADALRLSAMSMRGQGVVSCGGAFDVPFRDNPGSTAVGWSLASCERTYSDPCAAAAGRVRGRYANRTPPSARCPAAVLAAQSLPSQARSAAHRAPPIESSGKAQQSVPTPGLLGWAAAASSRWKV